MNAKIGQLDQNIFRKQEFVNSNGPMTLFLSVNRDTQE